MEGAILVPAPSSPLSPTSIPSVILTQNELKKIAAYKAVEYVESGMVLSLGTGSTAKHAVVRIGDLLRQGKLHNIFGIPTSKKTHEQAVSVGIPLADLYHSLPVQLISACCCTSPNNIRSVSRFSTEAAEQSPFSLSLLQPSSGCSQL